jgi:predicted P-loop ATPase
MAADMTGRQSRSDTQTTASDELQTSGNQTPRPNGKANGAHHDATLPGPELKRRKGKRKGLNASVLIAFMVAHTEWKRALRINLFAGTMEVSTQFPPNGKASGGYRPLNEPGDVLEAMVWFQNEGFPTTSKNLMWDVLLLAAHRNAYHPVRDYLDSLKWDGVPRVGGLFQHYFNGDVDAKPNASEAEARHTDRMAAYLEHTSECFMVSMVARVRKPGCKVDHTPVLDGRQGLNKSKALCALMPDVAWFSDDLGTDLGAKDTKDSLGGKWLIELSEMPHGKKSVEQFKAFLSRSTDRYRKSYDRQTKDWPREGALVGTSNELEFIDRTGNRRFWPIRVTGPIDDARITADRDQLWAEAVVLYEAEYQWWLQPNIEAIAAEQQASFQEPDIWTELLETWLEGRVTAYPFTLAEAFAAALGRPDTSQITKADENRAAGCLKSLGYRRRKTRIGRTTKSLWTKEEASAGE